MAYVDHGARKRAGQVRRAEKAAAKLAEKAARAEARRAEVHIVHASDIDPTKGQA